MQNQDASIKASKGLAKLEHHHVSQNRESVQLTVEQKSQPRTFGELFCIHRQIASHCQGT